MGRSNVEESRSFAIHRLEYFRWLAWACDAIDFFSVSLSVTSLTKQFNRSTHDIVFVFISHLLDIHLLTITILSRRLPSRSLYFFVPLVLWVSSLPLKPLFAQNIHPPVLGHLRYPIRPLRQEMASSLQSYPHCGSRNWSQFCSNLSSIPCSPLSVWYWNGRHLGPRSVYRPWKSSRWSSWYCEWFPPTGICSWLSYRSSQQSFCGSQCISWVESAVLDLLWHFNIRGCTQSYASGEWGLPESESSGESPRSRY